MAAAFLFGNSRAGFVDLAESGQEILLSFLRMEGGALLLPAESSATGGNALLERYS